MKYSLLIASASALWVDASGQKKIVSLDKKTELEEELPVDEDLMTSERPMPVGNDEEAPKTCGGPMTVGRDLEEEQDLNLTEAQKQKVMDLNREEGLING